MGCGLRGRERASSSHVIKTVPIFNPRRLATPSAHLETTPEGLLSLRSTRRKNSPLAEAPHPHRKSGPRPPARKTQAAARQTLEQAMTTASALSPKSRPERGSGSGLGYGDTSRLRLRHDPRGKSKTETESRSVRRCSDLPEHQGQCQKMLSPISPTHVPPSSPVSVVVPNIPPAALVDVELETFRVFAHLTEVTLRPTKALPGSQPRRRHQLRNHCLLPPRSHATSLYPDRVRAAVLPVLATSLGRKRSRPFASSRYSHAKRGLTPSPTPAFDTIGVVASPRGAPSYEPVNTATQGSNTPAVVSESGSKR